MSGRRKPTPGEMSAAMQEAIDACWARLTALTDDPDLQNTMLLRVAAEALATLLRTPNYPDRLTAKINKTLATAGYRLERIN